MTSIMEKLAPRLLALHRKGILIVVPLLMCIAAMFLLQMTKTCTVFPAKKNTFTLQTYSDSSEGGTTSITDPHVVNNTISFDYTLKKSTIYPYAGLFISLMVDSSFLDISKYNYLSIELDAGKAKSCAVYLKAFIDGFTKLDQYMTHEFLMKEVPVDSVQSTSRINLNEFVHPGWWLEENNIAETKIAKPHFSKMISMQLQNGLFTPFDTPIHVVVKKISFVKNQGIAIMIVIACTLIFFFAYTIIFMVFQRKIKTKQTVISYQELKVENDSDKDIQRIMNAVAKHFADSEFTVEKLAREAGVSASRIPGMLKERFSMNFKQYLNIIRIAEAKRLLRETDNQITTCAYNVGYNNIPHFNRTFKQLEGVSPKEYRKTVGKENKSAE
jgi:AraC-like DNA-binding protein